MNKTVLTDVDILSQEVHGRVRYDVRPHPPVTIGLEPVDLTEYTMREHKEKVLAAMRKRDIDVLAVYGERRWHSSGHIPRLFLWFPLSDE